MEQQLINALMKLLAKAGGASLVKDLIRQVDENGNPKTWTATEIEKAIQFVNWQTENFGTAEAGAIVELLITKYNLQPGTFGDQQSVTEPTGIQGLQ